MTTIVASVSQQKMASDSRVTMTGLPYASIKKVYRLKNGELLGFSGCVDNALKIIDWCNKGFDKSNKPTLLESGVNIIILKKTHITFYDNSLVPMKIDNDFYAIGSGAGAEAATAAMYCGKNVEEAIEIACKVDLSGSGLPVVIKSLK